MHGIVGHITLKLCAKLSRLYDYPVFIFNELHLLHWV
jgi:hypothetical protein